MAIIAAAAWMLSKQRALEEDLEDPLRTMNGTVSAVGLPAGEMGGPDDMKIVVKVYGMNLEFLVLASAPLVVGQSLEITYHQFLDGLKGNWSVKDPLLKARLLRG